MTITSSSVRESEARARKAAILADAAIAVAMATDPNVDLHALAVAAGGMSSAWWADVAMIANVRPPSPETVAVVQALIRHQANAALPADPFSGLPA